MTPHQAARRTGHPVRRAIALLFTGWIAALSWCYLLAVCATWAMLMVASERLLPATLLAYGPRWIVAFPLLLLLPLALFVARRALVPLGLAVLVVLGPIMGGRLSARTLATGLPPAPRAGTMRVMTLNSLGGEAVAARLGALLALDPDLLTFQECGTTLQAALRKIPAMHVAHYQGLCTLSRWPITRLDSLPRYGRTLAEGYKRRGSGLALRHAIASPHGPLVLVSLHLQTARGGLQRFMQEGGVLPDDLDGLRRTTAAVARPDSTAAEELAQNTGTRVQDSEQAARLASSSGDSVPVIVAGDFNLPVESTIYRRYWRGFTNAFEATGTGFGWTKHEGALRIRIDHVLTNAAAPIPVGTWLGPDVGSDHLPVIADLEWRRK
jgi:vancomycin resistance protein VanJ